MVTGNDYQSLTVLCCPFEYETDGLVKVEDLLHSMTSLIVVAAVIDHRTLYHKEESLLVVEKFESLCHGSRENVATVERRLEFITVHKGDYRSFLNSHEVFLGPYICISVCLDFLSYVSSVLSFFPELCTAT